MKKVLYILGQLADTDMQWILGAGRKERVASGETIIQEGQDLDRIFIVVDGDLMVTRESLGLTLARLRQGEVVGEISMLDSRPATATVTAVEDSQVFSVSSGVLNSKIQGDTGFAARFYQAMCVFLVNRLSRASAQVAEGEAASGSASDAGEASAHADLDNLSQIMEPDDLEWLRSTGREETLAVGQVIIHEGRDLDRMFLIEDGRLRVSLEAQGGVELALLDQGQVVGEMSLLDSRPPTATVTAVEETRAFAIPHAKVRRRIEQEPAFAVRFYRSMGILLADRLGRTSAMIGRGRPPSLKDDEREDDEISPEALDNVSLAGARFDWFLRELRRR